MSPSESQKRASLKWDKEHMVVLSCKLKREQAEKFKAHCAEQGKTANAVLREYALACIEGTTDTGGGMTPPAGGRVSPQSTEKQ